MEKNNKQKLIEEIFNSVALFQKNLNTISGASIFFSSINKIKELKEDKLELALSELWINNIQVLLNRYNALLSELREKYANINDLRDLINNFTREFSKIKEENDVGIYGKIGTYRQLFLKIKESFDNTCDRKKSLMQKGKKDYFLKTFLPVAGTITTFYGLITSVYYKLSLESLYKNIALIVFLWMFILYILWGNLYKWLNR